MRISNPQRGQNICFQKWNADSIKRTFYYRSDNLLWVVDWPKSEPFPFDAASTVSGWCLAVDEDFWGFGLSWIVTTYPSRRSDNFNRVQPTTRSMGISGP